MRIRIVLAAAVAVALVGAGTSSAADSQPAFYECVHVEHGGAYKNATCKTAASGHTGAYELEEGTGATHALKGFAKRIEMTVPGPENIEPEPLIACGEPSKPSKETGELTSPTTIVFNIVGGGCEVGCDNAQGKTTFSTLEGHLGWINQEADEVGIEFQPAKPRKRSGRMPERQLAHIRQACGSLDRKHQRRGGQRRNAVRRLPGARRRRSRRPSRMTSPRGAEEEPVTIKQFAVVKIGLPKGVEIKT